MGKHFAFDVKKVLPLAWELQWTAMQKRHAEFPHSANFITATDMVNQVRKMAVEAMNGEPLGSRGAAWGPGFTHSVRINGCGPGGVLGVCRDWLLSELRAGKLEAHNFGRGHVSGMRFRVKGTGMSEAEVKTVQQREERRHKAPPMHFSRTYGGRLLCAKRPVGGWYGGRGRSKARRSTDATNVTCPRCLKLIAEGKHNAEA